MLRGCSGAFAQVGCDHRSKVFGNRQYSGEVQAPNPFYRTDAISKNGKKTKK